jgi:hypothetical protein
VYNLPFEQLGSAAPTAAAEQASKTKARFIAQHTTQQLTPLEQVWDSVSVEPGEQRFFDVLRFQ